MNYKAGLTALLFSLPFIVAHPPAFAELSNYGQVSAVLHRGGAPSAEALGELRQQGVKTVIDLRMNHVKARHERKRAEKLGLKYFHIPLGFFSPARKKIYKALSIILDPKYQPVFIHCRQGADRTGTVVAIYQVLEQGKSVDEAYSQMRKHRFKPWLISLRKTVEEYAELAQEQEAPCL